jgi:hypothetical protein
MGVTVFLFILIGGGIIFSVIWAIKDEKRNKELSDLLYKIDPDSAPYLCLFLGNYSLEDLGDGINQKEDSNNICKPPSNREKIEHTSKQEFCKSEKNGESESSSNLSESGPVVFRFLLDASSLQISVVRDLLYSHTALAPYLQWQVQVKLLQQQNNGWPAGYLEVYSGERLEHQAELIVSTNCFLKKYIRFRKLSSRSLLFLTSLHVEDARNRP